jgi:hypothetical protein
VLLDDRAEQGRRLRNRALFLIGVLALIGVDNSARDMGVGDSSAEAPKALRQYRGVDGGHPLFLEPPPEAPALGSISGLPHIGNPPAYGVPVTALSAYERASALVGVSDPSCRLTWPVLAGIGRVESNHANNGTVDSNGDMLDPIYGPPLDGTRGTAAIPDEYGTWARAAGPMQFIPATWEKWSRDGNMDGKKDPQNVFDAALAAGNYLCSGPDDLSTSDGLRKAILSYNHSEEYFDTVSRWVRAYERGGGPVPDRWGGTSHSGSTQEFREAGYSQPVAPPPVVPGNGASEPPVWYSGDEQQSDGIYRGEPSAPDTGHPPPPSGHCVQQPPEPQVVGDVRCLVTGLLPPPEKEPLAPVGQFVGELGQQIVTPLPAPRR